MSDSHLGFNRAARFARLVTDQPPTKPTYRAGRFNRAARFARLVTSSTRRSSSTIGQFQ